MPRQIEVPDRPHANIAEVDIEVSTEKGGEEKKSTFKAELPKDLPSAIALLGEQEVFRRFINAYVVYLQGKERNRLGGQTKPRARASYLESLGI